MNKEHLVVALAKALGIQHEHHSVVGIDKSSIKARIRELKTQRAAAIEAHDHAQLKDGPPHHSSFEATDSQSTV